MRENRPYGSEGGEANAFPTPYHPVAQSPLDMLQPGRFHFPIFLVLNSGDPVFRLGEKIFSGL